MKATFLEANVQQLLNCPYQKKKNKSKTYSHWVLPSVSRSWSWYFCIKWKSKPNVHSVWTAYLDHDALILIIPMVLSFLHSIYNILQLRNLQHIFSDIKEEGKLRTGTGQNQTRIAARVGHCHSGLFYSVSKHIKENQNFCMKNHNMISISPSACSPALQLPGGKENVDSQKFYSEEIYTLWSRVRNTYSRSNSKSLVFGSRPFLFDSVKMPGGPWGLAGLQLSRGLLVDWGVCYVKSHLLNVFLKQRSHCVTVQWKLSSHSIGLVITTKEHTSTVSP